MSDKIAYARHGDIAVLTIQNPPVNALSHAVRQGLMDRMDQAEADSGVCAVMIMGEGRAFIAGADITEFGKPPMDPLLSDVINRIESSPLIVVASMHGVTLGGGLEVALGCHYRIAVQSTRIGMPEVNLGLIPGAGGTQRLPRLMGVESALDVMTTGSQMCADDALKMGVIDMVQDGNPLENGLAYVADLLAKGTPRRPVSEIVRPHAIDWDTTYDTILARGHIAPALCVRAVQASVEKSFAEGLVIERQIFRDLLKSDQSKGMIHSFFSERAVYKKNKLKVME